MQRDYFSVLTGLYFWFGGLVVTVSCESRRALRPEPRQRHGEPLQAYRQRRVRRA